MRVEILVLGILGYFLSLLAVYILTRKQANKQITNFKNIETALKELSSKKENAENELSNIVSKSDASKEEFNKINEETKDLQELRKNDKKLLELYEQHKQDLEKITTETENYKKEAEEKKNSLHAIMSKIDLYSRLDEFTEFGHFEMPEYLFETGERFAVEIKSLRSKQKEMIKNGNAFIQEGEVSLTGDSRIDKKIIDGQMKILARAFNIECDVLIGKVSPSNLERTLSRIEKLANDLEKLIASLRCGLNIDYVALKYEECSIQYQHTLKKKEEHEEQKLIREQIREEARVEKEYRDALAAAEKEEKLYRDLLEKAKKELEKTSEAERYITEAKITELEAQLAEAEAKEERVKSLAQQTRRGHVYVISNTGSFGENIYKIGMTRRLDPMDRVKELGDASVPFSFDVHAIVFADDAPAMEAALHRKFNNKRVNAVNFRKEFFHVELDNIREAVEEIVNDDIVFKTTIAAEEYYETLRLRKNTEKSISIP